MPALRVRNLLFQEFYERCGKAIGIAIILSKRKGGINIALGSFPIRLERKGKERKGKEREGKQRKGKEIKEK